MPRPPRKPAPPSPAALRREEATMRARLARATRKAELRTEQCDRAVQELDVYKEEVRQQTDELLSTQRALEASRDRYAGLYDFAPVAYLTLDRSGLVEELNLTAADMLGVDRPRVLKMPFLAFVAPPDRQAYLRHLLRCRRDGGLVTTELHVVPRGGGDPLPVMMSTWAGAVPPAAARRHAHTHAHDQGRDGRPEDGAAGPVELRTAVLDLSDRRRAQQQEAFYQQRLRSLASELALAEERERRRIAVEIHDQISQSLAMAKMKLDAARSKAVVPEVKETMREVAGIVQEVLGHTRSLTFELSPPVLHELGFEPALEWLAERAQQQYHIAVGVDTPHRSLGLPHELAVLLFQATRELLVNVVKHADAGRVVVRLRRHDGRVHLVVEDDGRGFARNTRARTHGDGHGDGGDTGFGLFSIRTRLEHYGGSLAVENRAHGGSRVTLTLPVHAADGPSEPAAGPAVRGVTPPPPQENRMSNNSVDVFGGTDNDGASKPGPSPKPAPSPLYSPEGSDHESAARRRPPHRARRAQKPAR